MGLLGGMAGCAVVRLAGIDAVTKVNLISLLLSVLMGGCCTFAWIIKISYFTGKVIEIEEDQL